MIIIKILVKYLKELVIVITSSIISLLFLTILYYYDYISDTNYSFFKILSILIIIFYSSYRLGNKATSRGYLEGIKLSLIIILLLFSTTIVFSNVQVKLLLYYSIIITTSILGSTFGIYKKRSSKLRTS